jgi:hypothetical protein
VDKRLDVVGIFLDLTRAYDVINHNILLNKLNSHGVRGAVNLWFKSYLSDCTQFVEITQIERSNITQNRYLSSLRELLLGVSQGLSLGPLLFLLYINDLLLNIQGVKLVLFANDINILVADKGEDALQHKILSVMKQIRDMAANE